MPFSQYCSRPSRQLSHSRQESTMQPTPTRSPTANSVTFEPVLLTVPTISWPGTRGYVWTPHSPRVACTSEWQSPQNSMAISTSSGFGARLATVSGTSPLAPDTAPYAAARTPESGAATAGAPAAAGAVPATGGMGWARGGGTGRPG